MCNVVNKGEILLSPIQIVKWIPSLLCPLWPKWLWNSDMEKSHLVSDMEKNCPLHIIGTLHIKSWTKEILYQTSLRSLCQLANFFCNEKANCSQFAQDLMRSPNHKEYYS